MDKHMSRRYYSFLFTVLLIVSSIPLHGRSHRVAQLPNGGVNGCANCHVSPGGPRNAFGQLVGSSYLDGDGNVIWNSSLAAADPDGDGFSAGHELEDPFGMWMNGGPQPGNSEWVSNPGDASSTPQGDAAMFSAHVSVSGMAPHMGQQVRTRLYADGHILLAEEIYPSLAEEEFEFAYYHLLEQGADYYFDVWADLNGNGTYDSPPVDHSWRLNYDGISENITIDFTHNTNFTDLQGTVGLEDHVLPKTLALHGNFPNPFNPTTLIRFSVPLAGLVDLKVFDMQGRLVREVYHGDLAQGEHALNFDAFDSRGDLLPAGIYIVRLATADQIETSRMTLIK